MAYLSRQGDGSGRVMGAFARITVNVAGREVSCYPTMGAMLLFEETTGKDVSKMDFTSVSDQFTYLYCCASEASAREKQELGMSLKEFAREVLPEDLRKWVEALTAASEEKSKKNFITLVSTKKSYEYFEIIEVQFVMSNFGAQRFEITFAV